MIKMRKRANLQAKFQEERLMLQNLDRRVSNSPPKKAARTPKSNLILKQKMMKNNKMMISNL